MSISKAATGKPTLYTLAPSHFSERARWALDYRGVDYQEHRLALGPHAVFLRAKGLSSTSLPVFALDGDFVQGSDKILDWCGYSVSESDIEGRFERVVGPLVRRYIYAAAFATEGFDMSEALLDGVSPSERVAGLAAWPILKPAIRRGFNAHPECLPEIASEISEHLVWFDAFVGPSSNPRPINGTFGRTDITAASLLSSIARPANSPIRRNSSFLPQVENTIATWASGPSLTWVRKMYLLHRLCKNQE